MLNWSPPFIKQEYDIFIGPPPTSTALFRAPNWSIIDPLRDLFRALENYVGVNVSGELPESHLVERKVLRFRARIFHTKGYMGAAKKGGWGGGGLH